MGVVITVVSNNGGEHEAHVGCGHAGAAYSWRTSDDGHWLIVRSKGGVPREQFPLVNVRRILVEHCASGLTDGEVLCQCAEVTVPGGVTEVVYTPPRVHRRPGTDLRDEPIYCDPF